jgi:glyoxylase-like metal-dependent hydrolase (beta-lactamase superfamily II)
MRGKRWLIGLSVLVAVLLGAKLTLLDTAASPAAPYRIDIDALHAAATASGPLPTRIEVQQVATFAFPRTLVVAGDGFGMHQMVLTSHRVVGPERTFIIDTAMSPADGASMPGGKFDEAAFQRVEQAMKSADGVLLTHEHEDHVGGVARAPEFAAIASRVIMTREQIDGPKLVRDKFAPGTLAQLKPLDYTGLHVVAPGIVLQKAPGPSLGTQLIYVELANGQRYLFVGDVAWTEDNIRLQRGRPALIALIGAEDRALVASQVAALADLPKSVHLVVAHDPVALKRDVAAGLFKWGFSQGAQ